MATIKVRALKGPRKARIISRANEGKTPRRTDWPCTDGCGHVARSRKALKLHIRGKHASEAKTARSAVSKVLEAAGLAACPAGGCDKVLKATSDGSPRAHKCKGSSGSGEAHEAPKTPQPSGAMVKALRTKRARSGDAHDARSTPTPAAARRRAGPGSGSAKPASLSRTTSIDTGTTTRLGRTIKRQLFFGEEAAADEGTEAAPREPTPPSTPPTVAPVVEDVPAEEPKFANFDAYASYVLERFARLNAALSADGPASADAEIALDKLLDSSWRQRRKIHVRTEPGGDDDAAGPAAARPEPSNEWTALHHLHRDFISRATRSYGNKGIIDLGAEGALQALESKYPEDPHECTAEVLAAWESAPLHDAITAADIEVALHKKKKGSGGDHYSWTPDDLKGLAKVAGSCDFLAPLTNALARGRFNHAARAVERLTVLRGIALAKERGNSTKVRPIGIGVIFVAITSSILNRKHTAKLQELAGPFQYAVGAAGGVEASGRVLAAKLDLAGGKIDACVGWEDGTNAFNAVSRAKAFENLSKISETQRFDALRYKPTNLVVFGNGDEDRRIKIVQRTGVIQGDALAMAAYCVTQNAAIESELVKLSTQGDDDGAEPLAFAIYADDRGAAGMVGDVIAGSARLADLLEAATGVGSGALHVYAPNLSDEARAQLEAAGAVIEDGGTVFAGTPIGNAAFVSSYATSKADELIGLLAFSEKVAALDPERGAQYVLRWIRLTIGPSFNHILRNVDPELSRDAARKLDDAIVGTVLRVAGVADIYAHATNEEKARARALIHLPEKSGGLGFSSQVILADAAYVGAWASSLHRVTAGHSGLGLDVPAADADMPHFLEPFTAALERLRQIVPAELTAKLEPRMLWEEPKHHVQHALSEAVHDAARQRFVASLPTGDTLADRGIRICALAMNTPEAGAWVSANPMGKNTRLTNAVLANAVRERLLLPALSQIEASEPCAGCAAPLDALGTHATCCPNLNRSNTHKLVQDAVGGCAKEAAATLLRAPGVDTYYAKKPEAEGDDVDNTHSVADLGITFKNTPAGLPTLVDFTVVAIVKGAAAPYESAGVVAEAAEIKKVKQYEARYAGVRIVGFGVEISGAFGPAAKRFTWKMAEAAGGPPHMVAQRYRRFCATVSVALQAARYNNYLRFLATCVKPSEEG